MKRLILMIPIVIACNSNPPTTEITERSIVADSIKRDPITLAPIRMTDFDSCKFLHERILFYIEQVDMKLMSKKSTNKTIDSLQKILYRLRDGLNLNQRRELSDYANHVLNEIVDRKVERDNK